MSALKYKQINDRSRKVTYLRYAPTKGQVLDFIAAKRVYQRYVPGLLPFSFNEEGKKPDLYYFIDGVVPLKRVLDAGVDFARMRVLLMNLITTLETCQAYGLVFQNLDLDPNHVYVRVEALEPQFIYLPLQNFSPKDNGILDLIVHVIANVRPANAKEHVEGQSLLSYLKEQDLFSLIDLKDFLKTGDVQAAPPARQALSKVKPTETPRAVRDFVSENSNISNMTQTRAGDE